MRSVKVTLLLAVSMFSLASIAASASAAEWHVNGSVLSGAETIAEATNVEEAFTLEAAGVTITCKKLKARDGFIKAPNTNGAEKLIFEECAVTKGACTVAPTLTTLQVKSTAATAGAEDTIIFEPKEGTNFITIKFEGEECALKGNKEVTGKVTTTAPTGQTELGEQQLVANSVNELKVGTNNAVFKGKTKIKIKSGNPFSFR